MTWQLRLESNLARDRLSYYVSLAYIGLEYTDYYVSNLLVPTLVTGVLVDSSLIELMPDIVTDRSSENACFSFFVWLRSAR